MPRWGLPPKQWRIRSPKLLNRRMPRQQTSCDQPLCSYVCPSSIFDLTPTDAFYILTPNWITLPIGWPDCDFWLTLLEDQPTEVYFDVQQAIHSLIYMDSQQPIEIKPTPTYESASIINQVNSEGEKEFLNMPNRFDVEKDAVFINYDKDQLIEKLKGYSSLNIYERVTYARHANVIREELQHIEPKLVGEFMKTLVTQGEEIKRFYLGQLKELVPKIIQQADSPQVYEQIKEIMLPSIMSLLKCDILDIKEEAGTLLSAVSGRLKEEEFQKIVKTTSEIIAEKEEDSKIVGVQVLSKLSQSASTKFTESHITKEVLTAASSESIRVKKEAILCLPLVCRKISDELFESEIIPFYQKKCGENAWAVRKACVQIIVELSTKATSRSAKDAVSQELLTLLKDGNKLVKIQAHKVLPLFVSYLNVSDPGDITNSLLQSYFKLIDSDVNNMAMSSQILYQLSYTFPGVLLNLGKKSWVRMFSIYLRLSKHTDVKVKRPLAYSFHQIAKVIGEQQSKSCLFECLDNILKDNYDDLKLGAIGHLAEFVQIFNREIRQNLVDVFLVLQKDPKKWRIRHSIASQLEKLIKIYDSDTILKYILPISLKLCNDPVAQVSYQASKHVWVALDSLKLQQNFRCVVESIVGYAQSSRFSQRQVFLQIATHLPRFQESFLSLVVPELLTLATDKVAIVRVRLAQLIANLDESMRSKPQIQQIAQILSRDKDEDVRILLSPQAQSDT